LKIGGEKWGRRKTGLERKEIWQAGKQKNSVNGKAEKSV